VLAQDCILAAGAAGLYDENTVAVGWAHEILSMYDMELFVKLTLAEALQAHAPGDY
jgi:hypothetical protein